MDTSVCGEWRIESAQPKVNNFGFEDAPLKKVHFKDWCVAYCYLVKVERGDRDYLHEWDDGHLGGGLLLHPC